MTLAARRWLYTTFILAFFIITSLVVSYANGYTISWSSGRLIKTGTFVFKTSPPGARIMLNGQTQYEYLRFGRKQEILTPVKIKNLLPGEYTVRFELTGYHPWEKKLAIKSGESTYAETVELFSDSKPIALNNETAKNLRLQNNVLSWLTDNKLSLYDTKNQSTLLEIIGRPKTYALQENTEHVIVDGDVYTSDIAVPIFSVKKIVGEEAKDSQFVLNQDKIAFSLKNKIQTIDLMNQKISTAVVSSSTEIVKFIAYDNQLQIIGASSSRYHWQFYKDGELLRSLELPIGQYEFEWLSKDWLALRDLSREMSYVVEARVDNFPIKTIKRCTRISYIKDKDFLCSNEYEIFTYNADSSNDVLLDRISEPVLSAYWHKTDNYVVYLTKAGVYTLELDKRDYRNKTKIMDAEILESVFDQNSSNLYISGIYGGQKGIFLMSL